ncbi:hypothetical protein LF1_43340 [Rubripirellula obstinata]|uniref:DUF6036 domain-containing protein n=1 Tax=Rubripirellula obstinata TaxID=406547 RepID=A0A5B1CRA2_9BACT|nr:DUF6036 family nucleotidyltransferase [Rubripirellula obstinata]KAA1261774.1 hypothetical protein LF1_43340 [Rubripirellula obstinata]
MNSLEAIRAVIIELEKQDIEYLLVGAFACNLYAVPRSTNDADFVVTLPQPDIVKFTKSLGDDFKLDPQMMMEIFTGSVRHVLCYSPTDFEIELFQATQDPHHLEQWQRKVKASIAEIDCKAWVPTAEDVVIQKLRWARRKDLDDVVNLLVVSGDKLDWSYIDDWATKHETTQQLKQLRLEAGV